MAICVGEHSEPMMRRSLGQTELHAIVASGRRHHVLLWAAGIRTRRRSGSIQVAIEGVVRALHALAWIANHERFVSVIDNRRIFDCVVEPAPVPTYFERQSLVDGIVHAEDTLMLP